MILAAIFAIVPVGVNFGDDTLLRLREFDPELSPPATTAVCGSPITHLEPEPRDSSFYELARVDACERAAKRRLFGSLAGGAVLFLVGLLGATTAVPNPRLPLRPPPRPPGAPRPTRPPRASRLRRTKKEERRPSST